MPRRALIAAARRTCLQDPRPARPKVSEKPSSAIASRFSPWRCQSSAASLSRPPCGDHGPFLSSAMLTLFLTARTAVQVSARGRKPSRRYFRVIGQSCGKLMRVPQRASWRLIDDQLVPAFIAASVSLMPVPFPPLKASGSRKDRFSINVHRPSGQASPRFRSLSGSALIGRLGGLDQFLGSNVLTVEVAQAGGGNLSGLMSSSAAFGGFRRVVRGSPA